MKNPRTTAGALWLAVGWALMVLAGSAIGADSPLWGDLQPGPFGVGFKTIELFDYSRSFLSERDYFGAPLIGEPARPVQVCYWYPTTKDTTGTTMVYSEYAFPYPNDGRLFPLLSALQNREITTMFTAMRGDQAKVAEIMNYRMKAVRDAPPENGPFPLIVYHGSERGAYCQNVVLCEYLASLGFVVATTHVVGAVGYDSSDRPPDIETAVRDKEFAVSVMHDLPFVDVKRLGLIGYNLGITTALIHQMRNYSVDAVATIYDRYSMDVDGAALLRSDSYNPARMSVPWLLVHATADSVELSGYLSRSEQYSETQSSGQLLDFALADTLQYCRLYSVTIPSLTRVELNVYRIMGAVSGADSSLAATSAQAVQSDVAPYVWHFFDADLNEADSSEDWLNNIAWGGPGLVLGGEPELYPPPTPPQFHSIMLSHGVAKAKYLSDKFGFPTPENPMLPDATYTAIGYGYLRTGDMPSALQVFAWGVAAWPMSANAWDSYGEACATSGDLETGLAHYRKALEVLPDDPDIDANLRTQLQTSIPSNIARLEQEIAARSTGGGETGE